VIKINIKSIKITSRNQSLRFGCLFLWRLNLRLRRARWCFQF